MPITLIQYVTFSTIIIIDCIFDTYNNESVSGRNEIERPKKKLPRDITLKCIPFIIIKNKLNVQTLKLNTNLETK